MKSKAYRAVDVNRVEAAAWLQERDEAVVHAGLDVGKEAIFCTLRWGAGDFDRRGVCGIPVTWFGWRSCSARSHMGDG